MYRTITHNTARAFLLLSMIGGFASAADAPSLLDEADIHFRHARRVIQENCRDCAELKEDALTQGLFEMRQAIDMNCRETEPAYQLLAEGYKTLLSVFTPPGSADLDHLIPELTRIYDHLLESSPRDPELLFERAKLYRKKDEKLAGFRHVLDVDSNYAPARFAVAYLLLEAGKTGKGLSEFRKLRPSPVKAELYRNTVAALLQKQGRQKEADQARRETFATFHLAERR